MYIELSNYLDTKERKIIVGMKELKKKRVERHPSRSGGPNSPYDIL